MFRDRHGHTIDAKGRVSIPMTYRTELQVQEDRPPFLTNLSRCLGLFPHDNWIEFEQRIVNLSQVRPEVQAFQRFLLSGADACPIDRQGRIMVPPHLRTHAELEREVTIAGVGSYIELWNPERFDREIRRIADRSEEIQSILADLGL